MYCQLISTRTFGQMQTFHLHNGTHQQCISFSMLTTLKIYLYRAAAAEK